MRIAVMGSGGVGGYFGAHLARAGQAEVTFIARGAHLAAILENGLKVVSGQDDIQVQPARATDDAATIGPVDIVLFATKLWDVEAAGEACKPLLGPDTAVISLLNGVDSEDRLSPILGPAHVAGGVAYISAGIRAPGVVEHFAMPPAIAFGEIQGGKSSRLEAFQRLAQASGIDARHSADIRDLIWRKFVLLATLAGLTTLARQPIGPIRDDPDLRGLLSDSIDEVIQVARAKGVELGDAADTTAKMLATLPAAAKSSMLMDLEKGHRLEIEWLSGAVVRLGRELGIDTPVHRVIHAALKPWAGGPAAP